jgi:DNA-binding HxlR family transcriptional regulator
MAPTVDTSFSEARSYPNPDQQAESSGGSSVSNYRNEAPSELELLDYEYAVTLLRALTESPRRGRELIDDCDGSRSTVYRHLNRLVEEGFVTTETKLDPDGHHCKLFRLVRDTVTVTVEDGSITVTVQ